MLHDDIQRDTIDLLKEMGPKANLNFSQPEDLQVLMDMFHMRKLGGGGGGGGSNNKLSYWKGAIMYVNGILVVCKTHVMQ